MILVAGGTGRLGAEVVARLTDHGEHVRVLTREPSRAATLLGPLVQVVQGDVRQPETLVPAMVGIRTVVSAVHGFAGPGRGTPQSIDRDGNANLVAAAKAVDADVVLVSVVGAASGHAMSLFRMKAAAEENLRAGDGRWTIVRAPAFLELYRDLMLSSAGKSGRPLVFGRGDNPINFASVVDVADAVVAAVLDPSRRQQTLDVSSPHTLTFNELAAQVQVELGTTDKKPRHIPLPVLHVLAATRRVIDSAVSRQAQAALVMDSADMTTHREPPAVHRLSE